MSEEVASQLKKLFKKVIKYRALGEAIAENYENQCMRCPIHLSIGQEFWLPVLGEQFREGDRCFSSHRSHSMYMALECNIEKMIAELHGSFSGSMKGIGGSMHLKDLNKGLEQSNPIVGSSIGFALGSALAAKRLSKGLLTVVYFGDGACEEGILHESLNMANIYSLPILFICENNGYSCNTGTKRRQSSKEMTRFAKAHGIISNCIEKGIEYEEIIRVIKDMCRIGRKGPAFLEIKSYRYVEHCGHRIDRDKGDRTNNEFNKNIDMDYVKKILEIYPELEVYLKEEKIRIKNIIKKYEHQNMQELML